MHPGAAAPVAASCAPVGDLSVAIPSGEVVVVGTVIRLENANRWALVRVEERWYGAAQVPDEVWVRGGPEAGAATGNDRTYVLDRYLFVTSPEAGYLADNACTATAAWTRELAQYRPRGVEPVADLEPVAEAGGSLPPALIPVIGLAALLVIVIVSYRVILVARRRPPDWMR
jgi:hypothetical protein